MGGQEGAHQHLVLRGSVALDDAHPVVGERQSGADCALQRVSDSAARRQDRAGFGVDQAVRDLLAEAQRRATAILKQNRELLDQTAEKLLMKETLSADELPKRVSFVTVPAPAAAAGGKLAGV